MGCEPDPDAKTAPREATVRRRITESEFYTTYPLLKKHFNPDPDEGWDGCMFETYGEEVDFVCRQDPRCIWTLVDGDKGDMLILSGYHFVNRIGYFVSSKPVPENQQLKVILDK
jgi:hypothetical protein